MMKKVFELISQYQAADLEIKAYLQSAKESDDELLRTLDRELEESFSKLLCGELSNDERMIRIDYLLGEINKLFEDSEIGARMLDVLREDIRTIAQIS